MAKRKSLDDVEDIFPEKTQAQAKAKTIGAEKPKDPVDPYGVGLRKSEWRRYEEIAAEMQMTKHGVALFALRYFLKQYDAGEIETGTRPTFKL